MKTFFVEVFFLKKPTESRRVTANNGLDALLKVGEVLKAEGETDIIDLHIYYIGE